MPQPRAGPELDAIISQCVFGGTDAVGDLLPEYSRPSPHPIGGLLQHMIFHAGPERRARFNAELGENVSRLVAAGEWDRVALFLSTPIIICHLAVKALGGSEAD
jgi:hypothetical protein